MKVDWHEETVSKEIIKAVKSLANEILGEQDYLGGGTGLALYWGHRKSADLDFFRKGILQEQVLASRLSHFLNFRLDAKDQGTVHGRLGEVKITFLEYLYPLLFPLNNFVNVQVADPRDIACMKIDAISARGKRRDFIDLYVASQRYGLKELLGLFEKKFAKARYNLAHVFKSLTYFDDAITDPMPALLIDISWDEVTHFFTTEVPRLLIDP